MSAFRLPLLAVFALPFFGVLAACEGMPTSTPQPTQAWSQQVVTQLAGQLAQQVSNLYTEALKEPEFSGERTAYGTTLQNLETLQEEMNGLHAELQDGKGLDATRTRYERINEISDDLKEDSAWEFLPDEFTSTAKSALTALDQLDAYYGVHSAM